MDENQPVQPQQVSPQPEPAPKTSLPLINKKQWPIVGLVLLSLILLGTTGYFAYQYYQIKRSFMADQFAPLSATPTPTTNPLDNWETYTSPKGEYSFKHPAGLKSDTGAAGVNQESIRFTYIGESQLRKEGMLTDGYAFVVTKITSSTSAQESAQKERDQAEKSCKEMTNPDAKISAPSNILVDNYQAWQFTIRECLGDTTTIFSENNGVVYRITLNYPGSPPEQDEYKATLNQILSTFKFLDQNTYVNQEYKFSFDLKPGERVVKCPNKNELNDNIAVWVTTEPRVNDSECATEGPIESFFASKKDSNNIQSLDDYVAILEAEGNDYVITKNPLTISGISGYRIKGIRDAAKAAPIPDQIDAIILMKNGIFYRAGSSYLDRNITIL